MEGVALPSRRERVIPRCAGMKRWASSFAPGRDPLESDEPWITYPAIEWLSQRLTPEMRGFEFGSGGSTIFLARRVGEITTVEHHAGWAERVRDAVRERRLGNVRVLHRPADDEPSAERIYHSRHYGHRGLSYERYARAIEEIPDGSLDFVFVDGRARVACIRHAEPKIRPGGWLILDNADRRRYAAAHRQLSRHRRLEFRGVGPRTPWRFLTTAWRLGRG